MNHEVRVPDELEFYLSTQSRRYGGITPEQYLAILLTEDYDRRNSEKQKRKPRKAAAEEPSPEVEIQWRIECVWASHLKARDAFYSHHQGTQPQDPTLTQETKNAIWAAIKEHDGHLLGPDQRERFHEESAARAAGVGIFYDPWCTGRDPRNDIRQGGRTYLEPWRPWLKQSDKPDPVPRYAALAFEKRANKRAQEAARAATA